ncbi:solute carrier family 35 member G1-like [Branchiostoma lanceolatum]|uniref:solute carrier family 35 member G1-like n=1 Tax=Branchiostoma lanceolatum TaxID=7740 RepID=UPI003452C837
MASVNCDDKALFLENADTKEDASFLKRFASSLKAGRGPLLSLLSTILYAISAVCMVLGNKAGVPGFQLLFCLRLTNLLAVLVCILIFRPRLTGETTRQNVLLILCAVANEVGNTLIYLSFLFAAPGIAFGLIQGSLPLVTCCSGIIFLKETIGITPGCSILICIVGVVMVGVGLGNQGANSTEELIISIGLPLAAAVVCGPVYILIRHLILEVSWLTVLLYMSSVGIVAQFILTYTTETPVWEMSTETAGYVAGLSLSQAAAFMILFGVLQLEKAAIAISLRTLVVPFTIVLDYIFLLDTPTPLELGGIAVILLGVSILSGHTWRKHHEEEKHKRILEKMNFTE